MDSNVGAILGGVNNRINTDYNSSFIAGSNIVLGTGNGYPGALHVNSLWADPTTIPRMSTGAPTGLNPGTFYIDDVTSAVQCVLMA